MPDLNGKKCHEFSWFTVLFWGGGRHIWLRLPLLTDKRKARVSARLAWVAGPEKKEYLLAFSHLRIGLHKQFLSSRTENKAGRGGGKRAYFFSSSRLSGNITLVTDPFLVWGLASLSFYLRRIPSVCHVNSSAQECLELRVCCLFLCVLPYFRECTKICLVIAADSV